MHGLNKETIPDLLVKNISCDLVMRVEEALIVGAKRAYSQARGMNNGHLPHILGQLRHFEMNEAYHGALLSADAHPTPIKGNEIITGVAGIFSLARFNISGEVWNNGRRSRTRKQMSEANAALEPLIQPNLFTPYKVPSQAVVFFVACFSGSLQIHPESPSSIQIAVPDRLMQGWLFKESANRFLQRYERKVESQLDLAIGTLKKNVKKLPNLTGESSQ